MPRKSHALVTVVLLAAAAGGVALRVALRPAGPAPLPAAPDSFVGSAGCRDCHESFYELWATSWHGLAMRPYSDALAEAELEPQTTPVVIGDTSYTAAIGPGAGHVVARGPAGEKRYPIAHLMGGKNVIYFLTPMARGHLQVLPVAFDARRRQWYDTTASMVRHALESDAPIDWTDRSLTFNTSCFGCHVSQLRKGYVPETDSYHTTWQEPGINCETCHGPGERHEVVMRTAQGRPVDDIAIIANGGFSTDQVNSLCASCHAKLSSLTGGFPPGELFFDHFGLATLEDRDFYPDGRDLGENFTTTLWRMNPCAQSGALSCVHCHTSSGRNRHTGAQADNACMPCHAEYVADPASHSHHPAESEGSRCVACHMPRTEFARMQRHDHSMLPPTPAATLRFKSPNACGLCHTDQDAAWADQWVRAWYPRDYQAPVLHRAGLVAAARENDFSRLPEMLAYVRAEDREEVTTASLVRLLAGCDDARKWPAIVAAARDPSPLVRASAAEALAAHADSASLRALCALLEDDYRLVRFQAVASLVPYPIEEIPGASRAAFRTVLAQYEASLRARPDDFSSRYNLGNLLQARGMEAEAIQAYEASSMLNASFVPSLVNAAMAYARLGHNPQAGAKLRAALRLDPANAAANFNMGLLLAESADPRGAEKHLRAALAADPRSAQAAYNLGLLVIDARADEGIELLRTAARNAPDTPRYAYALAFHLHARGFPAEAAAVLRALLEREPTYAAAIDLLASVYVDARKTGEAAALLDRARRDTRLPQAVREGFAARLQALGE